MLSVDGMNFGYSGESDLYDALAREAWPPELVQKRFVDSGTLCCEVFGEPRG